MKNISRLNNLGLIGCLVAAAGLAACSGDEGESSSTTGGAPSTGGDTGLLTGGGTGLATGGATGMGTGGATGLPTGGATGSTTGGVTGMPTGGATSTPTGGVTGMPTGGTTGTIITTGGVPGTATGGVPGTATGGSTGAETGGTAPTVDLTGVYSVADGAYVTACNFSGYAWTSAGPAEPNNETGTVSSIVPENFEAITAGQSLCATGVAAADDAYAGVAMVGVNLGQPVDDETGDNNVEVTPTGTGLYVKITNNLTTKLRVQIQDSLGANDENHRWCANAPTGGEGVIPWGDFNTTCWDNKGDYYAMSPINAVLILVPGSNTKDTPFDFCLDGFTVEGADCTAQPVTGTGGGGGGGAPGTGGETSSGGTTGVAGSSSGGDSATGGTTEVAGGGGDTGTGGTSTGVAGGGGDTATGGVSASSGGDSSVTGSGGDTATGTGGA